MIVTARERKKTSHNSDQTKSSTMPVDTGTANQCAPGELILIYFMN